MSKTEKDVLDHSSRLLREALISLNETQSTGTAIAVELQKHDEILDRCDKTADYIDVQLNVSDRLLRGMSGFWGRVVNAFTKDNSHVAFQPLIDDKKNAATTNFDTKSTRRISNNNDDAAAEILMKPSPPPTKVSNSTKEIDEQLKRDDENLDLILSSLRNVKAQAYDLNQSLSSQDKKIDILTKKVDRSESRVQKQNHKIWKMS